MAKQTRRAGEWKLIAGFAALSGGLYMAFTPTGGFLGAFKSISEAVRITGLVLTVVGSACIVDGALDLTRAFSEATAGFAVDAAALMSKLTN